MHPSLAQPKLRPLWRLRRKAQADDSDRAARQATPATRSSGSSGAKAGQQIRGNLFRGNDGKFSSGKGGGGKKASGGKGRTGAKPKASAADTQAARDAKKAERRANVAKVGKASPLGENLHDALMEFSSPDENIALAPQNQDALVASGLVAVGPDGQARMTAAGRMYVAAAEQGDVRAAVDAVGKGTEQQARRDAVDQRRAEAEAKKAEKKGGGGGGGGKAEKPKPTDDEKAAARDAKAAEKKQQQDAAKQQQRSENRANVGKASPLGENLHGAFLEFSSPDEDMMIAPQNVQPLLDAGVIERDTTGQPRMTAAGRAYVAAADKGDVRAASDAISRGREAASKRAAAAAKKRPAPRLRAGGVRPVPVVTKTANLAPTRTLDFGHTGVMVALAIPNDVAQYLASLPGVTEPAVGMHITLAYLGDSSETPLATNKARLITAIQDWVARQPQRLSGTINGVGRFFTEENDEQHAVYVSPDMALLPAFRQSLVEWIETSGFDYAQDHGYTPHITVAYVPIDAPMPNIPIDARDLVCDRVVLAWGDEQYEFSLPSAPFTVFKDANGAQRWLSVTTSAYQDRDGEWITTKAIRGAVALADRTGYRGPLRFWHVPGCDLGDCDYQAITDNGRFLLESGTFRSAAAARIGMAAAAKGYQMSPGFVHPPGEPRAGAYDHIAIFERSFVPVGRASNPYTAFSAPKETHMLTEDKRKEFETLAADPEGVALLEQLIATTQRTDKDLQDRKAVYKDAPEWAQAMIAQVNALDTRLTEALTPVAEEKAADDASDGDAMPDDSADETTEDSQYIGDMTPADFITLLTQAIKAALGEMPAAAEPAPAVVVAKDDTLAQLRTQMAQQHARLQDLEGDQPHQTGYRPTQDGGTVVTKAAAEQAEPYIDTFINQMIGHTAQQA